MIDISIVVAVYNHEKYIEKAIRSILAQDICFKYEVLIGEDCSTDKSRAVLRRMEPSLPSEFKIFYRNYNLGIVNNFRDLYKKSRGRYIIVLEGDDYWCYRYKLKEQFLFLESNKEYIAIAHNSNIVDENDKEIYFEYPECKNSEYTMEDFFCDYLPGQTTTILMRNIYKNNLIDENLDVGNYPGDRRIAFLLVFNGKIKCIQEKWSSYRYVTSSGSSFSATRSNDLLCSRIDSLVYWKSLYRYAKKNSNNTWLLDKLEVRYLYWFFSVLLKKIAPNLKKECLIDILKFRNKSKVLFWAISFYLKKRIGKFNEK